MTNHNRRQAISPGSSAPDERCARNEIEKLRDQLSKKFPNALIRFDPPGKLPIPWFLGIGTMAKHRWVHVSWSEKKGFGISDCTKASDLKIVDRRCYSINSAFQKVVEILTH